jgi:hypothetical protein
MHGAAHVETPKFPPFFPILLSGLLIGAFGWLGLVYVLFGTDPELGFRWLFFFFVTLGLSGTALPVVAYLNRRFPADPPANEGVLLRQAIWVGVYGCLLVWLQQGRILNPVIGFFLAIGMILVEVFLRVGERSRWRPAKEPDNE